MWRPDPTRLVRVRLHAEGLDAETTWAEDCGPAPGPEGARFLRLANVPFLHAKPTYGDVLVATPDPDGMPCFDTEGLPYGAVLDRLVEDGGRWVMIVDYDLLAPGGEVDPAFRQLDVACERADIVVEGCFAPRSGRPGRAYLAIPADRGVADVLAFLDGLELPLSCRLVHPRDDDEDGEG